MLTPKNRKQIMLQAMGIDIWMPRNQSDNNNNNNIKKTSNDPTTDPTTDPISMASWEKLQILVDKCTRCSLYKTRTHAVFGEGNRHANLLIIGEAPGANEDQQGRPFVGRAGQLLTAQLKAVGIEREEVFITNILKSRPPNNRDPNPEEVRACTPYLERQIELLGAKLVMAVGRIAAQYLLGTNAPLGQLRGKLHHFGAHKTPLLITYHPAYLLRSPREKRKAYEDIKLMKKTLIKLTDFT